MIGSRNRDVSRRKALRKRRIAREIYRNWYSDPDWELFDNLHQYSKNKIHCSCPMCSAKTRNKGKRKKGAAGYSRAINYKPSDLRKIATLEFEEPEVEPVQPSELSEYTVEFTATVTVQAEDSIDAVEKAREQVAMEDMFVYVDGNLF